VTIIRNFLNNHKDHINNDLEEIGKLIESGASSLTMSGLRGTSKYFIPHLISIYLKRPFIFISENYNCDPLLIENFNEFSDYDAKIFKKKNYIVDSLIGGNLKNTCERISALLSLKNGKNIVVEPFALFEKTVPEEILSACKIELKINQSFLREEFICSLHSIGFRKSELVEYPGQFSIRGAIIDIFSPGHENPVRTEFLGDSVRSLRIFDPKTQKSINKIEETSVYPASEFIYSEEIDEIQQKIYTHAVNSDISPKLKNSILDVLEGKKHIDQLEWLTPLIYESAETLLNYTSSKYLIFFDLKTNLENIYENLQKNHCSIVNSNDKINKLIPGCDENFISYQDLENKLKRFQAIHFNDLLSKSEKHLNYSSGPSKIEPTKNQTPVKNFVNKVKHLKKDDYLIHVVSYNKNEQNKLKELLNDYNLEYINFSIGRLESGFILKELKLAVFTENDISEKGKKTIYQFPEDVSSNFISSFSDLKQGNYIVHKQFGIGIYRGLKKIDLNGS